MILENILVQQNKLKNIDGDRETIPEATLKKEEDMPSGPKDEQFFYEDLILFIS